MFTSSVDIYYGFDCMAMHDHDDVQCQIQGSGIARIPYWGGKRANADRGCIWMSFNQQYMYLCVNQCRKF